MGIWHKEVIRVNGDLKAYIEVQDDYTGSIRGGLRDIHLDGNTYFVRADGKRIIVTEERQALLNYEDKCKNAIKWYDSTAYARR